MSIDEVYRLTLLEINKNNGIWSIDRFNTAAKSAVIEFEMSGTLCRQYNAAILT